MNKNRENHPIYKVNIRRIMLKATAFALALVTLVILAANLILN